MYVKVRSGGLRFFKFILFIIFSYICLSNYQFLTYDNGQLYVLDLDSTSNNTFEQVLGMKKVKYCKVNDNGLISYETYIFTNNSILYGGTLSSNELILMKASMKLIGVETWEFTKIPMTAVGIGFLIVLFFPTKRKVYYLERRDNDNV